MQDIRIGDRIIGKNSRPFIIAEMSGNHNQSLDRALEIVDAAAEAGADAIKLQTYTADTMTIKGALTINDPNSLWYGRELYDLYKEAYTPWEWHKDIFERAREKKIIAFSSPFDESAVDFLEELGVLIYKVASFENTDHPLLERVAATGKPVIMSTGVASLEDIEESVSVLKEAGCKELILLKCTSTYPALARDSNIRTIPYLEERFQCIPGLSDHTRGIGTSVASVAMGARVIEKHFTLSRADGGVDSAFSIESHELKQLVEESEQAFESLGEVQLDVLTNEKKSLLFKRSVFAVRSIKKGEELTRDNMRVIRPGTGLKPKYFSKIVGKRASKDIEEGTPLSEDMVEFDF